jgi:hypothetical protein
MNDHPEEGMPLGVTELGESQRLDGGSIDALDDRYDRAWEYATKAGVHLWAAMAAFQVSPDALVAMEQGQPLTMDGETLLGAPRVGCLVCEAVYAPRLRMRRCPGEPKGWDRR